MDSKETRYVIKKKEYLQRRSSSSARAISFSAKLPDDVCGSFRDCTICAVKYSTDPLFDIRESILEIIENVEIRDWEQMEELVYCYIALNSEEVRGFVEDAFLSLCFFGGGGGGRGKF